MSEDPRYIGIDVSKAQLDIAVRPSNQRWQVSYSEDGTEELISQLTDLRPALLVMEASGGLEMPLVASLAAASLPVVVVNPSQVRDFARATGTLAKTNAIDAQVLAHFAEAVQPAQRPLPGAEAKALSALVSRRRQVMSILVAEKNRLGTALPSVRPRIQVHITWLQQDLKGLDDDIDHALRQSPVWREREDLLRSVPGVGRNLAFTLLAYLA